MRQISGRQPREIAQAVLLQLLKGFRQQGLILTPGEALACAPYHYIETKTVLQFMAFMNQENHAPFIDVCVEGLPTGFLKREHATNTGQDLTNWMMLTYWRKHLNKNPDADVLLNGIVPACLDDTERQIMATDPLQYFSQLLGKTRVFRSYCFLVEKIVVPSHVGIANRSPICFAVQLRATVVSTVALGLVLQSVRSKGKKHPSRVFLFCHG